VLKVLGSAGRVLGSAAADEWVMHAVPTGGTAPPGPAAFPGGTTGSSVQIKLYAGGCGTQWSVTATVQEPDGPYAADTNTYTVNLLC
jgi:hypothetical protein